MLLRLLLTVGVFAYLAWQIDLITSLSSVLAVGKLELIGALILVALDRAVMIWRWVLLLAENRRSIPAQEAAHIFLVSSFVGSFLPAGIGADAARVYGLTKVTAQGGEAFASVIVDRLLGVMSILLLGLAGLTIWITRAHSGFDSRALVLTAGGVLAAFTLLWTDRILERVVPESWRRSAVGVRIERLAAAVAAYRGRRGTLAVVLALSLGVQVLRVLQAYLLGRGLGLAVPFSYYLVFMPVGLLMLLMPVSISGFGLPQGVIVWLLRPLGVPDAESFALSTMIVLLGIAGNIPGAWLYLRGRKGVTLTIDN